MMTSYFEMSTGKLTLDLLEREFFYTALQDAELFFAVERIQ